MTRIAEAPRIHQRHYVRKASAGNHWFDFMARKVREYRSRFGESFCLVVNGSDTIDDAYIVPYSVARTVFTDAALDGRGRWVGTIKGSTMTLAPSGNSLNVAAYHNAFELLSDSAARAEVPADQPETTTSEGVEPPAERPETRQFVLEAHLRDFLAATLECIESGLHLHPGGVEYPVENGRIDLPAVDREGKFVVIELKLSQGRNKTLGQILHYMSWVDQNLGNGPCRGVVIANEISGDRICLAGHRRSGVPAAHCLQ